jgi:hypothetical protein
MIDPKELKALLLGVADDIRSKPRAPIYDGALMVLHPIFVFLDNAIKKGEIDMQKLKDSVNVQVVRMGDIAQRSYHSEVQDKVLGWVGELQELIKKAEKERGYNPKTDKPALMIDPKEIKAAHLNTVVSSMRADKRIPETIRVVQRKGGELCYLVELEADEVPASRK